MHMRKTMIPLLAITLLSIFATTAKAQTDTPAEEVALGEVTGTLVNKSPGGTVSEKIELMLHVWDQNYSGQGMYHGESLPDGSFLFSDVQLDPAMIYAVMASYEGAVYFSESKVPSPEDTALQFEVPIYETTDQLSEVTIDQAHVLFFFAQGGIEVMEMYFLSNTGRFTVADAITLDDGRKATMKFTLPEDSGAITFNSQDTSRYIQFPGGFADTAPLVPGRGADQIAVRYVLPYNDGISYTFAPPMAVLDVEFLIAQEEGIQFEGEGLNFDSTKTTQDGQVFDVYTHKGLGAGETVDISISGRSTTMAPLIDETRAAAPVEGNFRLEIGLGALVLGLALVAAGVWWWRKPQADDEDKIDDLLDQPDYRDLVAQIVELDETYQAGEISEEAYQQQREALILQGKAFLVKEI